MLSRLRVQRYNLFCITAKFKCNFFSKKIYFFTNTSDFQEDRVFVFYHTFYKKTHFLHYTLHSGTHEVLATMTDFSAFPYISSAHNSLYILYYICMTHLLYRYDALSYLRMSLYYIYVCLYIIYVFKESALSLAQQQGTEIFRSD